MRIDFVIAGVQKAATTALWSFLRTHASLFLPERKELHFFDDETIDWHFPPYALYHQHFAQADRGLICGEATPIYTYWPPAVGRLRDYYSAIKLIVILRDPVARAYSQWRMEVARGAEILEFSAAIRDGRKRLAGANEIPGCHRVYVERGFYAEQIRRLLSCFPRSQVAFIATSDLRKRQRETLDGVCRFLGVSHFADYPSARLIFSHAESCRSAMSDDDIAYLRRIFRDDMAETEALIGRTNERSNRNPIRK